MNKPYTYKSGKLFLKISAMEGCNVYINGGTDLKNASETLVPGNGSVTVDKWYEIDQSSNFIITVVPKKDQLKTDFRFYYYTKGVKEDWYNTIYYNEFAGEENATKWYGALALSGILGLLIICIFFGCVYQCIKCICCKDKKGSGKIEGEPVPNIKN